LKFFLVLFAKRFQVVKPFAQVDESQMQFSSKMVGEAPVVVVQSQIRRANLADAQSLLLKK